MMNRITSTTAPAPSAIHSFCLDSPAAGLCDCP